MYKRSVVGIDIQSILSQNITLVYKPLDLRSIDTNKLRNLMDQKARPTLMDTPELIVALYPPEPVIIQIGQNRVRVTLPRNKENIGTLPLWEIAIKCDNLVSQGKSSAIAFGFNYDVAVISTGNGVHNLLKDLFVPNLVSINSKLDGDILTIVPRLIFRHNDIRYDLVLEAIDDHHIKAHLHAHFELKDKNLPTKEELESRYIEEYKYFVMILPRVFEGGM